MALLDPLTELPNRRCINLQLRSRIDELKRYEWPCGVLFIDIDNFKVVNDEYGHGIGDKVLKMVGRTLSSSLRSYDILGRYGGEEFFAIVANVDSAQLYSFADRLRLLVEQSSLTTGSDTVSVTISIGATLARSNDTLDTVIKRADRLMYHSKTAGRNRISTEQQVGQNEDDCSWEDLVCEKVG
jgi:diguanylate cyclase (GGDEF)-like protein